MSDPRTVDVTPWPTARMDRVPIDCCYVCSYENDVAIDEIEEAVLFRRAGGRDELWVRNEFAEWLAVTGPSHSDAAPAALNLVSVLFRSRVGFGWPRSFLRGGLIERAQYERLLAEIEAEMAGNAQAAQKTRTKIVEVAERLGLYPMPAGTDPRMWKARCPGTNHPLSLNSAIGKFFCGWCKRSGGPEELSTFAAERSRLPNS